jgi:methylthioribose-1-phosphate isomerase
MLAVLAHRHGIPFYVAAPTTSVDLSCPRGDRIPIEERSGREVTHIFERQVCPSGIRVANPAFDVTPNELITAIVTEKGIAHAPVGRSLSKLVGVKGRRRNPADGERDAEAAHKVEQQHQGDKQ